MKKYLVSMLIFLLFPFQVLATNVSFTVSNLDLHETAATTPTIANVISATPFGTFKQGDTVGPFYFYYSEAVDAAGAPYITYDVTSITVDCSLSGSSCTSNCTMLTFDSFVVGANYAATDLDTETPLVLNGGTINASDDATGSSLVVPTGANEGSLATNCEIDIDTTAPAIDGINNTDALASGDDTYTTENEMIAFVIETNTLLLEVTAEPDYPRILTTAIGPDGPVYASILGLATTTDHMLYGFPLLIGTRVLDLSTSGDLDVGPGGSVTDPAGNPVAVSMGALDLSAGAEIVLASHTTSASPWAIGSYTYYTTLALVDAATYILADDYFKWLNDTVDVFDVSAHDGTSGHEITYAADGYTISGTQVLGDYSIVKHFVHASTVTLGVGSVHSGSVIPVGSTLTIPNGATTCYIYNDGIGGTLDLDGACDVYNSWIITVDPTGLDGAEPVTFTNCHFKESEAVIEAKDGDDDLTFDGSCTFEITETDYFVNFAGGDYTLKPGCAWRHGGTHTSGYESKLHPNASTMDDILSIGPYGLHRGSAGM